jgi:hypothetical protein
MEGDLEVKISREKVAGVNAIDLREEMERVFADNRYLLNMHQAQFDDFRKSNFFMAILDVAAFAAQCAVRRANGYEVPLNKHVDV